VSHTCEAALVTCEDFRLHQRSDGRNCIGDFVRSVSVDCDVITRAGSIQDLARGEPGQGDSLLRDLRVSVELHEAKTIYLINHQDCGAYAHFGFKDLCAERQHHAADLCAAREVLHDAFPEVDVVLLWAKLEPGSTDRYVIEPLE